jgi:hypothetical protein
MLSWDETETGRTHALNGFLARWRRNASHAGLVAAALTIVVAAAAVLMLCACASIGSGRSFPP